MTMENKINIGELDTLVTIQSCELTIGHQGQKTKVFADKGKVWAKVERNVDETIGESNLEAGQSILLTCYKIAGLTTRWRVLVEGKPYEIRSIDPVSRVSPLNILTLFAIDG